MPLFVVVLLKRMSYNKKTKRKAENERQENERTQSRNKKAITADSAPDPKIFVLGRTTVTQLGYIRGKKILS